jgi:hypothetical protein
MRGYLLFNEQHVCLKRDDRTVMAGTNFVQTKELMHKKVIPCRGLRALAAVGETKSDRQPRVLHAIRSSVQLEREVFRDLGR